MKIRACKFVKGEYISTYKISIWVAASWDLNGKNLSTTLVDKAYEGAGINPNSPLHGSDTVVRGGPEWEFEVKIYKWDQEEVTE